MEELQTELKDLIEKYSILQNEQIKDVVTESLSNILNGENDYVIVEPPVKQTTTNHLTPEMEKILDDSLDEIEREDASTQTNTIIRNNVGTNVNRIDLPQDYNIRDMMDDIDRTYHDISNGIDEIGNYIGQWFNDIMDESV
jgi:predicted ribosome quality control (RQC) complex YloA/Tae2 family protein